MDTQHVYRLVSLVWSTLLGLLSSCKTTAIMNGLQRTEFQPSSAFRQMTPNHNADLLALLPSCMPSSISPEVSKKFIARPS